MPVIFRNPAGAPELACDACGCRWFDRMANACYECGEPVPPEAIAAFAEALAEWRAGLGWQSSLANTRDRSRPDVP